MYFNYSFFKKIAIPVFYFLFIKTINHFEIRETGTPCFLFPERVFLPLRIFSFSRGAKSCPDVSVEIMSVVKKRQRS